MVVSGPDGGPLLTLGNVLVEDCLFTNPAMNNTDGLTTLTVIGVPPHPLTNAVVRRCTVSGVKAHFRYSHGFAASHIEDCLVSDCQTGVYFEPNQTWGDSVGSVFVRNNKFLNVDNGVQLIFAAAAQFDSLTMIANEIVLNGGAGGWAFSACDTCNQGPSASTTNVTALHNIVRYGDWLPRPANVEGGLQSSDIRNAVFGNNTIALGTRTSLRVRSCPSGFIPPPRPTETCDSNGPIIPPASGPSYPPCLDILPADYRRAWFNNQDLHGTRLKVHYWNTNSDGFASQQQWP